MLTEMVSLFAVRCLETTGYVGAGLLMTLESMIAPVPSEAVMPFVGFLVADGRWDLWLAILATTMGSIFGSWLSYIMGYYGGRPFVLKVGKYLLLDVHDLALTEKFFQGRRCGAAVFCSRFIPVVRHLISVPAGVGRMRLGQFLVLTAIGATMWNTFLLYLGLKLREHWGLVQKYSHQVDIVVVVLLALAGGAFVWFRLKTRRAMSETSPATEEA